MVDNTLDSIKMIKRMEQVNSNGLTAVNTTANGEMVNKADSDSSQILKEMYNQVYGKTEEE